MKIENLLLIKRKTNEIKETKEMKKWIDKFKEEREFDGIKPSTIKNDIVRLKVFLDFCYNRLNKSPDELEPHDFIRFFNYLEVERKLSKNSQKKYFLLLKVFYRIMRMNKVIEPFIKESQERKRFSRIEIQHYDAVDDKILNEILKKILETNSRTSIRNALIVRMLWDTGCRVSEILNLKYKNCDFENGIFRIVDTKTHEERKVVCSQQTLEALRWYIQFNVKKGPEDYIFQKHDGKPVSRYTIAKIFNTVVKELKKEGKVPQNRRIVLHSLRHGRCVDLLEKGIPVDIVKEYLGHKSLNTTLFYSHSKERTEKLLKTIKKIL